MTPVRSHKEVTMVYQEKLVAAVKVRGKTLRESHQGSGDSEVFLPFGSEYSLFFKNLANRKVIVDVNIDGREAIKGLIVNANSTSSLERFLNESMNSGNSFKFIEKTDQVRAHRGDEPEDGLIEIRYKFEREITRVEKTVIWDEYYRTYPRRRRYDDPNPWRDHWTKSSDDGRYVRDVLRAASPRGMSSPRVTGQSMTTNSLSYAAPAVATPVNDAGITVEGSHSNQSFTYGHIGALETTEHVIVFHLKGETSTCEIVEKPVTTRKRVTCKYCGKRNTTVNKFCGGCGAAVLL